MGFCRLALHHRLERGWDEKEGHHEPTIDPTPTSLDSYTVRNRTDIS